MYTYIFLQTDLQVYISLKNQSREFHKRSKHFLFSDHFIVSHNLISWKGRISLGENWCCHYWDWKFFFVQEMKQESYSVCVWGAGGGREESFFHCLDFLSLFQTLVIDFSCQAS